MVTPRFVYSVYETRLQNKIKNENLPQHIGLIHDGLPGTGYEDS